MARLIAALSLMLIILPAYSALAGDAAVVQLPSLPEITYDNAAAFDPVNGWIIAFGGTKTGGGITDETWIHIIGDKTWKKVDMAWRPGARTHHSLFYLPAKKSIYLFGGRDSSGNYLNDTWVFTKKGWKEVDTTIQPSPRASYAVSPTQKGDRAILFGGFSPSQRDLADTWSFDGANWRKLNPTQTPSGRSLAATTPCGSGGVILFGGFGPGPGGKLTELGDTWIFNKDDWKRVTPAISPPPRSRHKMIYNRKSGETILMSGISSDNDYSDLWSFDGNDWKRQSPPLAGANLVDAFLFYEPKINALLISTLADHTGQAAPRTGDPAYMSDTWIYDGEQWKRIETDPAPKNRCYVDMAYDTKRKRMVIFGGSSTDVVAMDDTWEFDGVTWSLISTQNSPSPRFDHKMVYESLKGRALLFGGFGKSSMNDTWVFDGSNWKLVSSINRPEPRSRHSLAYDSHRNKTWLIGGYNKEQGDLADIWYLERNEWKKVIPRSGPGARSSASFAFDPEAKIFYYFGGHSQKKGVLGDTWSFNPMNNQWKKIESFISPPPRQDAGFVYDQKAGALTLFGGFNGKKDLSDTWVLVDEQWNKLDVKGPPARSYFGLAYDKDQGRITLFGGYGPEAASANLPGDGKADGSGTWEFDGDKWKKIVTADQPSAELSFALAYDKKRNIVVLFGGYNRKKGELSETWIYDGENWKLIRTGSIPKERANASLAYDPRRKKVIMFGGYNPEQGPLSDMWEFDGKDWKKIDIKCPAPALTGGANFVYDSNRKVFVYFGGKGE